MLPSIFGENLFDDFFNDPFGMVASRAENPLYGKHATESDEDRCAGDRGHLRAGH